MAFRRDYLKKVSEPEESESGDRCIVTTKDGRKIKVYAAASTLEGLRDWFRSGPREKNMMQRGEDVLEAIG